MSGNHQVGWSGETMKHGTIVNIDTLEKYGIYFAVGHQRFDVTQRRCGPTCVSHPMRGSFQPTATSLDTLVTVAGPRNEVLSICTWIGSSFVFAVPSFAVLCNHWHSIAQWASEKSRAATCLSAMKTNTAFGVWMGLRCNCSFFVVASCGQLDKSWKHNGDMAT